MAYSKTEMREIEIGVLQSTPILYKTVVYAYL
jgi:hypothetical protein